MTHQTPTHMRREIDEIPAAVARLLAESAGPLAQAGKKLRDLDPPVVVTIARGSSDHAATFLKYAIELIVGVPVASVGPSVTSIYGRQLRFAKAAVLTISQSGKSPDSVAMVQSARRGGGLVLALTNTMASPLADAADLAIDIAAGPEQSVAATKSFVNSIVAGLAILAHWVGDDQLSEGLAALPASLLKAAALDWSGLAAALDGRDGLYVLGRGPGLAIAEEAALKFKETCSIHAEAYSAAEVLHGPARLLEAGFPVLALVARDAAEVSVAEVADRLAGQGASVFATTDRAGAATALPYVATGHPLTDVLALIVGFYGFVEMLSRRRGFDPDRPPHLRKVTQTL